MMLSSSSSSMPTTSFAAAVVVYVFLVTVLVVAGSTTTTLETSSFSAVAKPPEAPSNLAAAATASTTFERLLAPREPRTRLDSDDPTVSSAVVTNEAFEQDTARIVGGNPSAVDEFPYYVNMYVLGCGGSLIAPRVVVTAAHCHFDNKSLRQTFVDNYVFVNAYDITTLVGNNGKLIEVTAALEHPLYKNGSTNYDFGLVLLKQPYVLDSNQYAHLNEDVNFPRNFGIQTPLTTMGLGRLYENGPSPEIVRDVTLPYITNAECKRYYGDTITSKMLCAGGKNTGKDSCQGDSGGPLVSIDGNNKHTQVGIVSSGAGCGENPGIYSRISSEISWIKKVVCQDWKVAASICGTLNPPNPTPVPTRKPTRAPTSRQPTRRPTAPPQPQPTPVPRPPPTRAPTRKPTRRPTSPPVNNPQQQQKFACEDATNAIGRFQFELEMDSYGPSYQETSWELLQTDNQDVIASISKEQLNEKRTYVYPKDDANSKFPTVKDNSNQEYYCLQINTCYTVKLKDLYKDGLNKGEGSYTGILDTNIVFEGNGDFGAEISHEFCVGDSRTEEKKKCPSNTKKVIYIKNNGKSKKCDWIKKGKTLQIRKKRCKKLTSPYNKRKIKHNCPMACGKHAGVGKCKELWNGAK